jgi:hypothetical protein
MRGALIGLTKAVSESTAAEGRGRLHGSFTPKSRKADPWLNGLDHCQFGRAWCRVHSRQSAALQRHFSWFSGHLGTCDPGRLFQLEETTRLERHNAEAEIRDRHCPLDAHAAGAQRLRTAPWTIASAPSAAPVGGRGTSRSPTFETDTSSRETVGPIGATLFAQALVTLGSETPTRRSPDLCGSMPGFTSPELLRAFRRGCRPGRRPGGGRRRPRSRG